MAENPIIPFDRAKKRRYTRATASSKTDFDMVSFRAPAEILRKIDELLAERFDPDLKTRSDCLNDALFSWLERTLEDRAQSSPRLHDSFVLSRYEWMYGCRQQDLEEIERVFKQAIAEHNDSLLQVVLFNGYRLKNDLDTDMYASPLQKLKLEDLIEEIKKRMEKS